MMSSISAWNILAAALKERVSGTSRMTLPIDFCLRLARSDMIPVLNTCHLCRVGGIGERLVGDSSDMPWVSAPDHGVAPSYFDLKNSDSFGSADSS